MKVLHIGEYARGGVATYINELLDYQSAVAEINDLYLLLDSRSASEKFALNQEHIFYYDFGRKAIKAIPAIIQIKKYLHRLRPDIIHIHSSFAGFLARTACIISHEKPIIIYCAHGWSFNREIAPIKKWFLAVVERILAKQTDLIINVSAYEHQSAGRYKIASKKMELIYNGVRESNAAVKAGYNQPLALDSKYINLLFVGRFDRAKGLDILLQVWAEQQWEHIRLYLIGAKVLNDQKINIPSGVINLGWVQPEAIDAYYQLFDAVIIPSRWEGFGLVAIEAMRNHKAVLASNRGSLPEIVQHGINGFLFDLKKQLLVNLLYSLNKNLLSQMGEQGYKIFKEKFVSQRMHVQILEHYLYLIRGSLKTPV